MNEILPEVKGIYRKTIYGIARGYDAIYGRYWDKGRSQSVWWLLLCCLLIGVLRHMQRYFSHICDGPDVQAD